MARTLILSRPPNAKPSNHSLLKLLRLVFQGNIFTFSDGDKLHYYLQTNGVSMGSKCAPSVACVYMGDFERQHLSNLPTHQPKPLIWLRYIDDIFAIWPHGKDSLLKFNSWLYSRHPRIQFTCVYSDTSVDFLDTTVKLENGSLQTELFIKPTSSWVISKETHATPPMCSKPYHTGNSSEYAETALPSTLSTTSQTSFWKPLSNEDTTMPPFWGHKLKPAASTGPPY